MTCYLERNLDMPLSKVLSIIHDQINQTSYFGVKALKNPSDH